MKIGVGSFLRLTIRASYWVGEAHKTGLAGCAWPQPGGSVEHFTDLPPDRYITIGEGTGSGSEGSARAGSTDDMGLTSGA